MPWQSLSHTALFADREEAEYREVGGPFVQLADYLNTFAWSQADLARAAGVSPHCVARALTGKRISRRNAAKIVAALDEQWQKQATKGHITMASIRGMQIAPLHRKFPQH